MCNLGKLGLLLRVVALYLTRQPMLFRRCQATHVHLTELLDADMGSMTPGGGIELWYLVANAGGLQPIVPLPIRTHVALLLTKVVGTEEFL